jgi:hypothetical protein
MKKFSDFGIKVNTKSFSGDKISVDRILNRLINVIDYKIECSKFEEKGNGKCLHLQIELNSLKYVVFTGSVYLMNMIQQVAADGFPFETTIIKVDESYRFS